MEFNSVILLILSLGVVIGSPMYMFFRERMGNQATRVSDLSRRRVFKLTAINFMLNSLVGLILLILFINLVSNLTVVHLNQIIFSLFFMMSAGATYYGNGIYITSIILEAYTLPELQRIKEFKTQFIATHLFHGPISHVLIYSGWPVAMFFLAFLEYTSSQPTNFTWTLLLAGSTTTAIVYSVGQIYSHIYPYQMITNSILGAILLMVFFSSKYFGPIYIYSLAFTVTTGIILWTYFVQRRLQGKSVEWYISPDPLL